MSRIVAIPIVLALLLAAGCTPQFENDNEELNYLSAIAEPSQAQLRRKQELQKKAEDEQAQELERAEAERRKDLEAKEAARRARLREESHQQFVGAQERYILQESILKFK